MNTNTTFRCSGDFSATIFRAIGDISGIESVIPNSLRTRPSAAFSSISSNPLFSDLEASKELLRRLKDGLIPNWLRKVLLQ